MRATTRKKSATTTTATIVLIASLALLFIATVGCGLGFSRGNAQLETYDFQRGTEGVKIEFLEGMPPRQLFIGTEFSTGLRVKNMGAYDISDDAEIKLTAPEMSVFQFKEGGNTQQFQLRGKSLYTKEGEEAILTFPMKALCFPGYASKAVNNYTRKIKATTCYRYETAANVDICIDTLKFQRQAHDKPECVMQNKALSGGQGGPVGLTSISPSIIPQSQEEMTIQLAIAVDKLQGIDHEIYGASAGGCADLDQQNNVEIEVQMGNQLLQCEPSTVKLKERAAVSAVCKRQVDPKLGAFLTPVTVRMKYYVQQNALKDITIEPAPGAPSDRSEFCASIGGKREEPETSSQTTSGGASCSEQHEGYSCKTVSCGSDESIDECAARQGCYRHLCPGAETNICCP